MVGGQVIDMQQAGKAFDLEKLKALHGRKTGALILFCIRLGARLAQANYQEFEVLERYGRNLGLLFQVVDDLLDVEADSATLGKTA